MENLVTLLNSKKELNGLTTRTINFKKENDKIFHIKDIKNMVKSLDTQYKNKKLTPQYVVRGINKLGVMTIKPSEKDIESMGEELEDYLAGRVVSNTKFQEFTQIQIIVKYKIKK